MPWEVPHVSELRLALVHSVRSAGLSAAEAARRFGVSRKTAFKWLARHDADPERRVALVACPPVFPLVMALPAGGPGGNNRGREATRGLGEPWRTSCDCAAPVVPTGATRDQSKESG